MIEQKMQTATTIPIIRERLYPKEPTAAPDPPDVGDGMIELDAEVGVEVDDGVAFDEVGVGGMDGVEVDDGVAFDEVGVDGGVGGVEEVGVGGAGLGGAGVDGDGVTGAGVGGVGVIGAGVGGVGVTGAGLGGGVGGG